MHYFFQMFSNIRYLQHHHRFFIGGLIQNVTLRRSRDFYIGSIVGGNRKIGWTQICSFHIRRISHISTTYFLSHLQDFSYFNNLFPFTFTGFLIFQQLIIFHIRRISYISASYLLSHLQDFSHFNNLCSFTFPGFLIFQHYIFSTWLLKSLETSCSLKGGYRKIALFFHRSRWT